MTIVFWAAGLIVGFVIGLDIGYYSRNREIRNLETLLKSTMPRRDARGRFTRLQLQ